MRKIQSFLHLLHQAIPTKAGRLHSVELENPTGYLCVHVWAYNQHEVYKFSEEDLNETPDTLVEKLCRQITKDMGKEDRS